eukprot:2453092-Ditylum_brightwellii.AAC.2
MVSFRVCIRSCAVSELAQKYGGDSDQPIWMLWGTTNSMLSMLSMLSGMIPFLVGGHSRNSMHQPCLPPSARSHP